MEEREDYVEPNFEAEDVAIGVVIKVTQSEQSSVIKKSRIGQIDDHQPEGYSLSRWVASVLADALPALFGDRRKGMLCLAQALSQIEDDAIAEDDGPGPGFDVDAVWPEIMDELGSSAKLAGKKRLEEMKEWKDSFETAHEEAGE
ncbi:hypothetical protein AYO47_03915 [Planctomyces sp. SCGC AG-212-M04]|nr:hypothetical protein AYO47_03915 [Planctomyces sp. SCGC AG-212-M04]